MRIGICSWSLQAENLEDLIEKVDQVGIDAVQLALDPVREGWGVDAVRLAFSEVGVEVISAMMAMEGEDYSTLQSIERSGGVRPDETWEKNQGNAIDNAAIAADLGIELVTLHAGFIPHRADDPERRKMLQRLAQLADTFAARGVKLALETGQESAATLEGALEALGRSDVGVNFDPANMILYGMGNPVEALVRLAPRVAQIHIKDALASEVAGEWGSEVVVGTGEVDWQAFATAYHQASLDCHLVVEREAGEARVADARSAVEVIDGAFGR